jgi:membrane-associated protease RseP (regulator of RpoE activity)
MYARVTSILVFFFAWMWLAVCALAQAERQQPQPARQPPAAESASSGSAPGAVKTQRVPFLGTATTQLPPERRAETGLPEGVGLLVRHVLSDSPAEAAGLRRDDVLHKLNDQILFNDPQFRALLRLHRPGDAITLTFIRQGKSHTVTVRLDQREVPVGDVPAGELLQWLLRGTPRLPASRLASAFTANYEDDEHVLVLSSDESGSRLLAKTRQGEVLFDGAVDTPEQRDAVPEAIREKLKRLETPPKPKLHQ